VKIRRGAVVVVDVLVEAGLVALVVLDSNTAPRTSGGGDWLSLHAVRASTRKSTGIPRTNFRQRLITPP
jgi:hypothetical protein